MNVLSPLLPTVFSTSDGAGALAASDWVIRGNFPSKYTEPLCVASSGHRNRARCLRSHSVKVAAAKLCFKLLQTLTKGKLRKLSLQELVSFRPSNKSSRPIWGTDSVGCSPQTARWAECVGGYHSDGLYVRMFYDWRACGRNFFIWKRPSFVFVLSLLTCGFLTLGLRNSSRSGHSTQFVQFWGRWQSECMHYLSTSVRRPHSRSLGGSWKASVGPGRRCASTAHTPLYGVLLWYWNRWIAKCFWIFAFCFTLVVCHEKK